jgi:hypothetical protein
MTAPMSRLNYLNYYHRFGIHQLSRINAPKLFNVDTYALPLDSVYHHVTYDGVAIGPMADDSSFANITKPIQLTNITVLSQLDGNPRRVANEEYALIHQLRSKNRRLKVMANPLEMGKDHQSLVVYNYCLLGRVYRYTRGMYANYYRWRNTFATIVDHMTKIAEVSTRQQFILTGIPPVLPSMMILKQAQSVIPQALLDDFATPQACLMLEIWRWLSEERSKSLLGAIPEDKLQYINVVYQEAGRWMVLNLGYLNQLREDPEAPGNKKQAIITAQVDKPAPMPALDVQKRFLILMIRLMQARTLGVQDVQQTPDVPGDAPEQITLVEPAPPPVEMVGKTDLVGQPPAEAELAEAAAIEFTAEQASKIDEEIAQLNQIGAQRQDDKAKSPTLQDLVSKPANGPLEGYMTVLNKRNDSVGISVAQYEHLKKQATLYQSLAAPNGQGTLGEYVQVNTAALVVDPDKPVFKDSPSVLDKTMLRSSLTDLDSKYVEHGLHQHTAAMVLSLQHAGMAVTEYNTETVTDVMGDYISHTVRIAPIEGAPSTLKFKLPVVKDDGTFTTNGTAYRLRRQFSDLPIRKIGPDEVALTSYYGKTFVQRGRKANANLDTFLHDKIMSMQHGQDDGQAKLLTDVKAADVFRHEEDLPRIYTSLSKSFREFTLKGVRFMFDRHEVLSTVDPKFLAYEHTHAGMIVVALSDKHVYMLDQYSALYAGDINDISKVPVDMGAFLELLGVDLSDMPVESCDIKIFAKYIPIGVFLAYHFGLEKLVQMLGVTPRRVPVGTRIKLDHRSDYALTFSNETWVLSKDDAKASLILGGWQTYAKTIKLYSSQSFDTKAVYYNLMDAYDLGVRYLREMDLMNTMFIDPITLEVLKQIKEPQTFTGLLLRACEMLLTDKHPRELDINYMRIKSTELMAGAVYTEMINSLRMHNAQMAKSTKRVELAPYAVWQRIVDDPVKIQLNQMNPFMELKENESLTFSGTQGRSSRSMVRSTRVFDPSHQGIVSESTVDSSDVAINVFLSANAKIKNTYGMVTGYDYNKDGMTSTVSTSVLMASGADRDDMRRAGFISIQNAHTVACDGYHQATVRTGYDTVIGQRTSDLYCATAKKPGKVKEITPQGVVVEYDDGQTQGYSTGRTYGKAAGLVIPHDIVSPVKVGDVLKVGDVIIYNSGFFEPDFFDPKQVAMRTGVNVRTVLWESNGTLEDASSITPKVSALLGTRITKIKTIVIPFTTQITNPVQVGKDVEYDTPVCVLHDQIGESAGAFNDATMDNLARLSSQSPKAGVKGVVERIEVFYHGEIADMTESMKVLAVKSDKERLTKAKALGQKVYTGQVDTGFRIEGESLSYNSAAIMIYITSELSAGVGDKGVFSHQLKSVFSGVTDTPYRSEDGQDIDSAFGTQSLDARIVNSVYLNGTANLALQALAKAMVSAYEG